jgi:hypothetical protein
MNLILYASLNNKISRKLSFLKNCTIYNLIFIGVILIFICYLFTTYICLFVEDSIPDDAIGFNSPLPFLKI